MHEMSIAQNILDIVSDTLGENEKSKLKEIVVDIGELVAVVPDSLQFCYDAIIQDTIYKNAVLTINVIPLKIKCADCGNNSRVEKYSFLCPNCHSSKINVVSGEELNIRYLEVD